MEDLNSLLIILIIILVIVSLITVGYVTKLWKDTTKILTPTIIPPKIEEIPMEQPVNIVQFYDRSKLYDPQVNPDRRPSIDELPTRDFQKEIDIATRGYPDAYIMMGLLISDSRRKEVKNFDKKENRKKSKKNNKYDGDIADRVVLKLFGRKNYPYSARYEYYALDDNYGNYIKYPIDLRRDEIYDGDDIRVVGFDRIFNVNLYKYDMPRYYPYII
jgi:hypothetical protein